LETVSLGNRAKSPGNRANWQQILIGLCVVSNSTGGWTVETAGQRERFDAQLADTPTDVMLST
jgi:hypothetical protein